MDDEFFSDLRERVLPYFEGINPCHDFFHIERVLCLAMKIGEDEGADLNILKMAVLLHDVARREQDDCCGNICHAVRGGEIAREILAEMGVEASVVDKVVHCVEAHRNRGSKIPLTVEAKVLFDADKLDAIGAIGIGRSFSFSGSRGSFVHTSDFDLNSDEEYGEKDCAYREFLVSQENILEKMMTKSGRRLAKGRIEYMKDFFDRLVGEVEGNF